MNTEFRYRGFINIHGHNFFMDLRKFTCSFKDSKFVDNDPRRSQYNTCYLKLQLNEKIIPWINSRTKSTKIRSQRILMKPQHQMIWWKWDTTDLYELSPTDPLKHLQEAELGLHRGTVVVGQTEDLRQPLL